MYQGAKLVLLDLLPLSKDAFHIYVGFTVFLVAAWLLRTKHSGAIPLLAVFSVAIGMEALDAFDDLSTLGYLRYQDSIVDIVNTTMIPLACVIFRRCLVGETSNRENK